LNTNITKSPNLSQVNPKKTFISALKRLSKNETKEFLAFSFYGSMFNSIYVSDGKIADQISLSRGKANTIKNNVLKKLGLITVKNRGANRTCITKVNFNILNNIDLVLYFMDEIKSLAGVFGYHITRFLKISYRKILDIVFSSNFRDKNIEVLYELETLLNKHRDLPKPFQNLPLVERICLSVFPLPAIEYALNQVFSYPCKVKNRLSLMRYLALYYVKLYDLSSLIHLSDWLYRVSLKHAVNTKYIKNIKHSIFKGKNKSMFGVSLLKSVAPKGVGCKRKQTPHMQKSLKSEELGPRGLSFMNFIKSDCS